MKRRTPARIKARDRFEASIHEAAHVAVADHYGFEGYAEIHELEVENALFQSFYNGHFKCVVRHMPVEVVRQVAVAGAVGVCLFDRDFCEFEADDTGRLSYVHGEMSRADCELAGFPTYLEDDWLAEQSEEFVAAVKEVTVFCLAANCETFG